MKGPPPKLTEAMFTLQVLQLAKLFGWRTAHFRAAQTKYGWRTPVQGDGAGFPDLVLVRERVVWAELKLEKNTLSSDQLQWSNALLDGKQEWYLWRPADWEQIEATLR